MVGVCPHPGPPCTTGTPLASPLLTSTLEPFILFMVHTGAECARCKAGTELTLPDAIRALVSLLPSPPCIISKALTTASGMALTRDEGHSLSWFQAHLPCAQFHVPSLGAGAGWYQRDESRDDQGTTQSHMRHWLFMKPWPMMPPPALPQQQPVDATCTGATGSGTCGTARTGAPFAAIRQGRIATELQQASS